jgi:hypothetical protein
MGLIARRRAANAEAKHQSRAEALGLTRDLPPPRMILPSRTDLARDLMGSIETPPLPSAMASRRLRAAIQRSGLNVPGRRRAEREL